MDENTFKRQNSPEEFLQEAVEYAPSEEGDLVTQLKDKIRSQAQRLRTLEQYKLLCEEKIEQLSPHKQLSERQEHRTPETRVKKNTTRQKSDDQNISAYLDQNEFPNPNPNLTQSQLHQLYQNIYLQFSSALKDKSSLEESLRSEMFHSEEQRTYIEVLKQALEARMEDLNISAHNIDAFTDFTYLKTENDNRRYEACQLHSTILDQQAHIDRLTVQLSKKSSDSQVYEEDRFKIEQDLSEAAQAMQLAEDEVHKLEEEKSALIDYIETQGNETNDIKEENRGWREEYEGLKHGYEEMAIKCEENEHKLNHYQELTQENRRLKDEMKHISYGKDSTAQNLDIIQNQSKEKDLIIDELRGEVKSLEGRNLALQGNNSTLSSTLQETQSELDWCNEEVVKKNGVIEGLKKGMRGLEMEKSESEENTRGLEAAQQKHAKMYEDQSIAFNSQLEKAVFYQNHITTIEKELHQLKGHNSQAAEQRKEMVEQSDELKRELGLLQKAANELSRREAMLGKELDNYFIV